MVGLLACSRYKRQSKPYRTGPLKANGESVFTSHTLTSNRTGPLPSVWFSVIRCESLQHGHNQQASSCVILSRHDTRHTSVPCGLIIAILVVFTQQERDQIATSGRIVSGHKSLLLVFSFLSLLLSARFPVSCVSILCVQIPLLHLTNQCNHKRIFALPMHTSY